jgi:hypothetical protein
MTEEEKAGGKKQKVVYHAFGLLLVFLTNNSFCTLSSYIFPLFFEGGN